MYDKFSYHTLTCEFSPRTGRERQKAKMTRYADALLNTPQTERTSPEQVQNSAGGYVFQLDPWQALDRWLILGAEGGTYYASEQKLARENAQTVLKCLELDGPKTVARIVEISEAGRAPKNDPAIFALALACAHGDVETKAVAFAALPRVCRTGTHLFSFAESVNSMRGWGRGLRRAVGEWYQNRSDANLVYQLAKYRQRGGWSHRDLLRLSHPVPATESRRGIYRYVTQKDLSGAGEYLSKFEELQTADLKKAVFLVLNRGFTHEMVPGELKNHAIMWEALLENMPITAMIRNLAKMTAVGLLAPLSDGSRIVCERLSNSDLIRSSRAHPIQILSALLTYQKGHGVLGSLHWQPVPQIVAALEAAFYLSFGNVAASGKKTLIALDVSGSMNWGTIAGVPGLTPRMASAAMAMVTMRTEPEWYCFGFTGAFVELKIHERMSLSEVVSQIDDLDFGSTDCALPMVNARHRKLDVEAFQIWTDNETWCGRIHPHQALKEYRQESGNDATLAVIGCTATKFTIADPSDPKTLDVVGFDTATPNLLATFAKGWV